jgi:lipoic acid synthetase
MLGLGEALEEVASLMDDARAAGCRILSIGQYLQPSRRHLPVAAYVEPSVFEDLRGEGLRRGFDVVVCGPLVRSSFHSGEQSAFVRRVLAARPEGAAS